MLYYNKFALYTLNQINYLYSFLAPSGAQEMPMFVQSVLELAIFFFLFQVSLKSSSGQSYFVRQIEPKILRLVNYPERKQARRTCTGFLLTNNRLLIGRPSGGVKTIFDT